MKRLWLVGLSHKTAPIAVREQVALSAEVLKEALQQLRRSPGVEEAMVVSTCNRVEVYVRSESSEPGRRFFLDRAPAAESHLYEKRHEDAARHLFRVASSLDSMVVGEQQILGQVKEAYGLASAAESAGTFVSRLCNRAFATAKRIRTETDIGKGATSMSQVAVELVEKIFGDLKGRAILLAGAGKIVPDWMVHFSDRHQGGSGMTTRCTWAVNTAIWRRRFRPPLHARRFAEC